MGGIPSFCSREIELQRNPSDSSLNDTAYLDSPRDAQQVYQNQWHQRSEQPQSRDGYWSPGLATQGDPAFAAAERKVVMGSGVGLGLLCLLATLAAALAGVWMRPNHLLESVAGVRSRRGPTLLGAPGNFDLTVERSGRTLGCMSPNTKFPDNLKYGCGAQYAFAKLCDSLQFPVRETQYVQAVHTGCDTAAGRGTYGYAFDDGVGLRQCAPLTKYEWILCPSGTEQSILWQAEPGHLPDSSGRFRVTNKCNEPVWIQIPRDQAAKGRQAELTRIEVGGFYVYSIPNRGMPAMRYVPKIGCDGSGNNCLVQSMQPCPTLGGCDAPIDTKFEASWGCRYHRSSPADRANCQLTDQGHASSLNDWWDGSAVDGWTLPFSVITDGSGQQEGTPCGSVVCAYLDAETLCPRNEFLTPEV